MIKSPSKHLIRACSPSQHLIRTLRKLKPPQTMVVETTRVSGLKVVEVAGKDVEEAAAVDQAVQAADSWV